MRFCKVFGLGLISLPRLSLITANVLNQTSGSIRIRSWSCCVLSSVTNLALPAAAGSFTPLASPALTPCAESLTPFGRFTAWFHLAGDSSFKLGSWVGPAICSNTLLGHARTILGLQIVSVLSLRGLRDRFTRFSLCWHNYLPLLLPFFGTQLGTFLPPLLFIPIAW